MVHIDCSHGSQLRFAGAGHFYQPIPPDISFWIQGLSDFGWLTSRLRRSTLTSGIGLYLKRLQMQSPTTRQVSAPSTPQQIHKHITSHHITSHHIKATNKFECCELRPHPRFQEKLLKRMSQPIKLSQVLAAPVVQEYHDLQDCDKAKHPLSILSRMTPEEAVDYYRSLDIEGLKSTRPSKLCAPTGLSASGIITKAKLGSGLSV